MNNMTSLLQLELNKNEKVLKPDFNTKSGREFFALYLRSKFKQILTYDSKTEMNIFKQVNPDFITKFTKRLINIPAKKVLIGISGESASGKTTICNTIKQSVERLKLPVEIISADNYFRDISELIKQHGSFDKLLEAGYDVDSPDNFNLEQLFEDLKQLTKGEDVKIPKYLVNGTGVSIAKSIPKRAEKIIIVEGMASMYGEVADLLDIKIYIDIAPEIQEKWFLYRAVTSRNQTEENAKKQLAYVREASKKYILPKKEKADIIINGACSLEYFNQILDYFYIVTNNFTSE